MVEHLVNGEPQAALQRGHTDWQLRRAISYNKSPRTSEVWVSYSTLTEKMESS